MSFLNIWDESQQKYVGISALKGEDGAPGPKGDKGDAGAPGSDGNTPVKGVDYYTEADKTEIVQDVLAELPDIPEDALIVTVTITGQDEYGRYTGVADYNAVQIRQAMLEGRAIYAYEDNFFNTYVPLHALENVMARVMGLTYFFGGVYSSCALIDVCINGDGEAFVNSIAIPQHMDELWPVTEADSGKVMRVSTYGSWAVEELPESDNQSAYAAAQAGGYTGTQSQFYADLAAIDGLAAELAAI